MNDRRLLHVSDVHFGAEDPGPTEAAIAFAHAFAPAVTVVTGDLTLNGLPREFEAAAAWLARLPQPRLVTPGNHDTPYWNLPLRALQPFGRYRRYVGDPHGGGFDGTQVRVRMINSARGAQPRPDWSKGAIDLDACRAAAAQMADTPGALRVVGCHHPLVELADSPVTGGVHRGVDAASLLGLGGVDLILTGHVHVPFAIPLAQPDGLTYAVGAGTLSVRLRGEPPSLNAITWDEDEISVVVHAWTGSKLAPTQTWTLPRRLCVLRDASFGGSSG